MTATTREDAILVAREGATATVTLNRPDKLNALTKSMWRGLGEAIGGLSGDATLRCIILRGAGERAFSPGNDIGEFARERSNKEQARAFESEMEMNLSHLDRAVGNFRINIFRQRGTISMVIRYVRSNVPPFEALKLPRGLRDSVME